MTTDAQWPFMGYAPGMYICTCPNCGIQYQADKRSTKCRDCIILALRAALDTAEARLRDAVEAKDEAESMLDNAVDKAPEPLKRLGEWLAGLLDEDHWPTAERLLNAAAIRAGKGVE